MDYTILDTRTGRTLDALDLHVLARAYYSAWRMLYGPPPQGRHPLPMLHLVVDFQPPRRGAD